MSLEQQYHKRKQRHLTRLEEKNPTCTPQQCLDAYHQGSLLSAQLLLEQQGYATAPSHANGGSFCTQDLRPPTDLNTLTSSQEESSGSPQGLFATLKREFWDNQLEVLYKQQYRQRIPVCMLLILFPLSYGSLLFLLLLPLFFNVSYRFSREGSFLAEFNPIIQRMSTSLTSVTKKIRPKS